MSLGILLNSKNKRKLEKSIKKDSLEELKKFVTGSKSKNKDQLEEALGESLILAAKNNSKKVIEYLIKLSKPYFGLFRGAIRLLNENDNTQFNNFSDVILNKLSFKDRKSGYPLLHMAALENKAKLMKLL